MACSNAERVALGKLACSKPEQEHSKVLVQEQAHSKVLERVLEHSKGQELEQAHNKVLEPEQVHSKVPVLALVHSKVPVQELARNKVLVPELGSKVPVLACSNESVSGGSNAHALDDSQDAHTSLREALGSKWVQVPGSSRRHRD